MIYDGLHRGQPNDWIDPRRQDADMARLMRPIVAALPHIDYVTDAEDKTALADEYDTFLMIDNEQGVHPIREDSAEATESKRKRMRLVEAYSEANPSVMIGLYNEPDASMPWPGWRQADDGMDWYTYCWHLCERVRGENGRYEGRGSVDVQHVLFPCRYAFHEHDYQSDRWFRATEQWVKLCRSKGKRAMLVMSQHLHGERDKPQIPKDRYAEMLRFVSDYGFGIVNWGPHDFDPTDDSDPITKAIMDINGVG